MKSDCLLIKPVCCDKTETLIIGAEVENFNFFTWYLLPSTQNCDKLISVAQN